MGPWDDRESVGFSAPSLALRARRRSHTIDVRSAAASWVFRPEGAPGCSHGWWSPPRRPEPVDDVVSTHLPFFSCSRPEGATGVTGRNVVVDHSLRPIGAAINESSFPRVAVGRHRDRPQPVATVRGTVGAGERGPPALNCACSHIHPACFPPIPGWRRVARHPTRVPWHTLKANHASARTPPPPQIADFSFRTSRTPSMCSSRSTPLVMS